MPGWDATLYLRFADERTRPAADLLARIPLDAPAHVVDLGCGPGNSTDLLRRRWPRATVVGVDSSAEMLAAAKAAFPDGRFVKGDVALAKKVLSSEDESDQLRNAIQKELIEDYMVKDGTTAPRAVQLLLIARFLERICDHAASIAEDVIYMVQAEVVRHHPEKLK